MRKGRVEPDGRGTRVAVFSMFFPPEYSGAGLQLAVVLDALRRRGIRFAVLTASAASSSAEDGFVVRRFRPLGSGVLAEIAFGLRAAFWLLRHPRWDLLHTIDFSYYTLPPYALARLLRRPVLVKTTLLEDDAAGSLGARVLRAARGFGYRAADAVVALSDALEQRLREGGVRRRILRIPNGVDTARFRPATPAERDERRRALGVPEGAFVITLCAMRIARKNPVALVEAAARMAHRPVHVLLLGPPGEDPAYEARLQAAIRSLPAGVTAHVLDDLPADGVAAALRAADVYVLPSSGEGLPNSLLEGMATGLACVATDIPGSRDVLARGGGLLVPLGDAGALTATLDRLAGDAAERLRLGDEALARIREDYALERVAERYGATYAALLGVPGAAARG